ncbi:hypothetical protein [Falsiroseomonas oryzae]|uniref:hypothetical protein n=1 Tax=Falsiroseomonas oryzae TaxID=2766473 RepID=UPI0022EA41A7|nr:hypothetical protein [Roseomonas sp. MO-31]
MCRFLASATVALAMNIALGIPAAHAAPPVPAAPAGIAQHGLDLAGIRKQAPAPQMPTAEDELPPHWRAVGQPAPRATAG